MISDTISNTVSDDANIILIGNGTLVTRDPDEPIIFDGCAAVRGNLIADRGKTAELKAKYPRHAFVDAAGGLIMPGLINTHTHIYSAFARGMTLDGPPNRDFLQILENLWWRLDKALNLRDVEYSALTAYTECIKNGVTTVFDHHASQRHVAGSLDVIAGAARRLGVRASLCYEVSDRDGAETAVAAIGENARFIRLAQADGGDMIKGMFGLHASMTLSPDTLDNCLAANHGLNAGFHVHAAEGAQDLRDSLEKYGVPVVERLYKAGVLGDKTIAAHCIHIGEGEMEILADTKTAVAHNPESNMGNAVGCADVITMLERGVLVGLGTDGYTPDMLESFKCAGIIQKHVRRDASAAWAEPSRMLFYNNRAIAGRYFNNPIGIIKNGAYADIVIAGYGAPTPVTAGNIDSHILFGLNGRCVRDTMINGRFVVRNGAVTGLDEREVFAKSREQAADFWASV